MSDDDLIKLAKKRFKQCADFESVARANFTEDLKFCNADSYNMYQYPSDVQGLRGYGTGNERPMLTVNKTAQHCYQIINDARQNKSSIKVIPTGNGATYEAAEIYEGIVRHIEYVSDAQSVYSHATTMQVQGGIGYIRIETDYISDDSFDQDIFIRRINDPLSVYMDCDSVQSDGSDMRYCFIFTDMPRDEFENMYPKVDLPAPGTVFDGDNIDWMSENHVRVAEYYYRTEVKDKLFVFTDPLTGDQKPIKLSQTKGWSGKLKEALDEIINDPYTKMRDIISHDVKWCKFAGDQIIDRKDWLGETIPVAYCVGIQTFIDGVLDRKGHTRCLIDSQRMLNYNVSASVEYGALQSKSPFIGSVASIEGYENYWKNANRENYAILPYNHVDDKGNTIPPPTRAPVPVSSPLFEQGAAQAVQDMMQASGQYQPTLGQPSSNEISGKAIQARQRQGENATYHFIDHNARMIRRLGKILIDLIPKIYDTPRIIKIIGEDGSDTDIQLDPSAAQAHQIEQSEKEQTAEKIIFNPSIGDYSVMSDIGPSYASQREEAFNALSQIAAQNPSLMSVIGDLVLMAADFPMADEAAERLKRMVPPQALGEGPDPQVQHLTQQLQTTQQLINSMTQKMTELENRANSKDVQNNTGLYDAVTKRLDALLKYSSIPAKDLMAFSHDLALQEHDSNNTLKQSIVNKGLDDSDDSPF